MAAMLFVLSQAPDVSTLAQQPISGESVVFTEADSVIAVEAEHCFKLTSADVRDFHFAHSKLTPVIKPDGDPNHVAGTSGEPFRIVLDIKQAGEHTIQFSMREFGFKFHKWLMTSDLDFHCPERTGSDPVATRGSLPEPIPFVEPGEPPVDQATSTPAEIQNLQMPASMFSESKVTDDCMEKNQWLALNPDKNRNGIAECSFRYQTGNDNMTLQNVGEDDGKSFDELEIDGESIGSFNNPLRREMYENGADFNRTRKKTQITERAIIQVDSTIGSEDGNEFSRARWRLASFQASDNATRKQAASTLKEQVKQQTTVPGDLHESSPSKPVSLARLQLPRQPDGDGSVNVTGERKQWHKITLDLNGPFAHEQDNDPNPFTDYRMTATFTHADGAKYVIPGYFAADGNAANSSANSGTIWRAHFAPDRMGKWSYVVSFSQGKNAALDQDAPTRPVATFDGASGIFRVMASDKTGRDLRAHGRLDYVGKRYLQFAGTGQYFLKVGADAPETLLAYADFDNTIAGNPRRAPLKTWSPHIRDWKSGDPTWGEEKGKGLIGAINYLSGKGCNAFSFLTYNAGGDGDNVWPFIEREDKLHYDCSKLDQWSIVFDHGTARGMYLHFKMQETENDDDRKGKEESGSVPESLDGGNLFNQRKLYCRELIARFGHNLALNWNLGEENTQSTEQQQAMIDYIAGLDAYGHNIVLHTFPDRQDQIYLPLIGNKSRLTGLSLQNSSLKTTHAQTVKWVSAAEASGKPWVVAFDESGSAKHAQSPDLGYNGFDGHDRSGKMAHTQHEVRKQTLWGTLMAGGAGNEYYFGYQFDENDILCEDWRSRDQSWDYCRIAINFFHDNRIPFWEMKNADQLVGNPDHGISKYCFAKSNDTYLVYLPEGGTTELDLGGVKGEFDVHWFNPRCGGELKQGSVLSVQGGHKVSLGKAPVDENEDWLVVVQ